MSYTTVIAGLGVRFATVSGLSVILAYAPVAVNDTPLLYSLFERMTITESGQVRTNTYEILHRVVVKWGQDSEQAEKLITPFLGTIPAAVRADPQLGTVLTSGFARIDRAEGAWVTINGVEYRAIDFHSTVVEKVAV